VPGLLELHTVIKVYILVVLATLVATFALFKLVHILGM
jgi:hypothetical protein